MRDRTNEAPGSAVKRDGLQQKVNTTLEALQRETASKGMALATYNLLESLKHGESAPKISVTSAVTHTSSLNRVLKAMSELNDAYVDLDKAKKEEANIHTEEKMSGIMTPEEIEIEIEKSQEILHNLREQEGDMDRTLTEKVIKRDEAILALKLQSDDFEKKMKDSTGVAQVSKRVEAELAHKEKEFRSKMLIMGEDKVVLDALLDGMQKMNGVENILFPTETKDQTLPINVEFTSGMKAEVVLGGEDMRLENIRIIPSHAAGIPTLDEQTLTRLLSECRELAPPNDLRHAMFCLYSAPLAPWKLAEDIAELRKQCIVKSDGPLSVEFTASNGLIAKLKVHDCYPNVPAGVLIESLQGGLKWSQEEVESLRVEANSMCFSTVFFMYDYLCSKE